MTQSERVLLKISGESLMGDTPFGLNFKTINYIAKEIKEVFDNNHQICLIIGGGNIYRGIEGASEGVDRSTSDYMGMLATVMNALSMQSSLESISVPTRVQTAISMAQIAEPYIRRKAIRHLEKNRIVIFAGGTGNPYFTTDTAAVLRGIEIDANVIIKGTKVDGVYSSDPFKNDDAVKYESLSFKEAIDNEFKVMDLTAFTLCKENNLPIIVTNINNKNNLKNLIKFNNVGTIIS